MKHKNDVEFNAKLHGKQKFGFRKLSVGLAAVALGTCFYLNNSEVVHADTDSSSANDTQTSELNTKHVKTPVSEKEVKENKAVDHDQATIETSLDNSDGTSRPVDGNNVMAHNDSIQANVSFSTPNLAAGEKLNIKVSDPAKWEVLNWEKGQNKDLGSAFTATYNGDSEFTIACKTAGDSESSFNLSFGLLYGPDVNVSTTVPLTIAITKNDGTVLASKQFNPVVIPFEDKVQRDEIAHGWAVKPAKSVNNNDDNAKNILDGTAATQKGADRKMMQYQIEWNYGKAGNTALTTLSPLDKAEFTAKFSKGQTLLPDTIKVFRVYQPDAVKPDGSRVDINKIYNNVTAINDGKYTYEDVPFEQFLRDHLVVSTNGQNLSWADYQKALNKAKEDHTEPPFVDEIHIDETDMHNVALSDGSTHNFAENAGENLDKTIASPHSTFFIQMDTLLDSQMPEEWTKPGNGPSMEYNTTSGKFNGVGVKMGKTTSTVFRDGGGGFSHEKAYSATLHFADVSNNKQVIDLSGQFGVTNQKAESNTGTDQITFTSAADLVKSLEDHGYVFVGASYGDQTSSVYDGSTLYTSKNYDGTKYGNFNNPYQMIPTGHNTWTRDFTLNFVHGTKEVEQKTTVNEVVKYIYANGPHKDEEVADKPSFTRSVQYGRTATVDAVTGDFISATPWKTAEKKNIFVAVDKPETVSGKNVKTTKYHLGTEIQFTSSDGFEPISKYEAKDGSFTVVPANLKADKTYTYTLTIPYRLDKTISLHLIDEDAKNGTEISAQVMPNHEFTGEAGTSFTNPTNRLLEDLANKGYVFDENATLGDSAHNPNLTYDVTTQNFKGDDQGKNKYNNPELTYNNDEVVGNQNYYIYVYHNITSEPEEKTIVEHIKYVDENTGKELSGYPEYVSGTMTITRTKYTDHTINGNGRDSWSPWSVSSFVPVAHPAVPDYQIDAAKITQKLNNSRKVAVAVTDDKQIGEADMHHLTDGEFTVLPDASTLDFVVPYVYNPPYVPQPSQPTEPTSPTTPAPVHPQTPENPGNHEEHHGNETVRPHATRVEEHHYGKNGRNRISNYNYRSTNMAKSAKAQLPATGEKTNNAGIFGLAVLAFSSLIALVGDRKRKN